MDVSLRRSSDRGRAIAASTAAFIKRFEWPLAKAGRLHVHRAIEDHDLPVTHETRRSGSPYTLVLTKTRALFERERAKRKRWKADLEWIEKLVAAESFGGRFVTQIRGRELGL